MRIAKERAKRKGCAITVALFLIATTTSAAENAAKVKPAEEKRPGINDCTAGLIKGRPWSSDIIFTWDELDVGIKDGTDDNSYPAQRAANDYGACTRKMLLPPERDGKDSYKFRMTVVPYAPSASRPKDKKNLPTPKVRPYVTACIAGLDGESWKMKVDLAFATKSVPEVRSWAVSSNLPPTAENRRVINTFAECIGEAMQLSTKPEFK